MQVEMSHTCDLNVSITPQDGTMTQQKPFVFCKVR